MIVRSVARRSEVRAVQMAVAAALLSLAGCTANEASTEAIDAELTRLEHEAGLLEDSKAIKRLQRSYGYYVDKGMGDRIGELFSDRPDASVEIAGSGVYVGKDRVSEFYTGAAGSLTEGQLNNHMILQGVVHIASDQMTAKGRWRGLIQTGMHGESAEWAEGPYENEYVKEDGVWKFHKVHWYATLMAPYDPGWHMAPRPIAGPSTDNPPDLPPTEDYQSYPSVHLPAYHYDNPVTGPRPEPAPAPAAVASSSLEDAWARLRTIEARAARVDDVNQLENLQRSYGYYLDKMLWNQVVDLFADNGTMEIGPSGVYEGRDSIEAYLYSLSEGELGPLEGVLYNHFQLQPIVTVAPDGLTAKARWRTLIQLGVSGSGSGGSWGEGVYENEYIKEDGVWKIAKLHAYPTFIAPYEGGWANASQELLNEYSMGRGVEPDSPSSDDYRPYPAVFVPPFHYEGNAGAVEAPVVGSASNDAGDRTDLEAALAETASKIERLDDVDELDNLAGIYGFYVDKSMQDDIADLFTDDGVVEILGRGVFEGNDRVREYMHNLGPVGPRENGLFNHMHLQPVITVAPDGQSALIRARLFVMFGIYQTNAQWGAGIYENEFVKEDGIWKIDYLHGYQTFYTLYEDGWARRASGIFAPYPQLPPGGPQSVPYDPYPAAFVPPFHYANPVTGRQ